MNSNAQNITRQGFTILEFVVGMALAVSVLAMVAPALRTAFELQRKTTRVMSNENDLAHLSSAVAVALDQTPILRGIHTRFVLNETNGENPNENLIENLYGFNQSFRELSKRFPPLPGSPVLVLLDLSTAERFLVDNSAADHICFDRLPTIHGRSWIEAAALIYENSVRIAPISFTARTIPTPALKRCCRFYCAQLNASIDVGVIGGVLLNEISFLYLDHKKTFRILRTLQRDNQPLANEIDHWSIQFSAKTGRGVAVFQKELHERELPIYFGSGVESDSNQAPSPPNAALDLIL